MAQRCRFLSLLVVSLMSVHSSFALQFGGNRYVGNVRVRVTDTTDRAIGVQAHVQLVETGSASVSDEGYCNDDGMISFASVPVGTYHILISGDGLEPTDSGTFEVDERKSSQSVFVRVKRTADTESHGAGGPAIHVRDLNVPEAANKEFDQANKEMAHQDWAKAVTHLNRAVAIYPKFVEGYSNLGAAYQHLGDSAQERESLQKAIDLDGSFAPALMNLGMLSIIEKNYAEAEGLLGRGAASDPTNPQILMLLAQAQLLSGHFDEVIVTKDKLHILPHHEKYAKVHYIAARAFEHENRSSEAAAELQTLLAEQPEGPLADAVRRELTTLRTLNTDLNATNH